ncbi:resistance to homoserine/threonine (RhtB) family protein [Marininema mesophilum]|uniref:Resistance to homoserine/threonine (RhtB) family protein n=1 Tax=Marininema mesophilum TaxID=1048340 RepID=A0A1H2YJU6_9BACL|nr:LysE family transporter [Marininema mesophilum]SDX05457.1 resistance to homoserine/threonine (RhtB) family protein [Marininema mesophilum]
MTEFYSIVLITILATMSPGPDFAMITRNSYLYGRPSGLFAALGISLGVQVHVLYTIFGIGLIISQSVILFTLIKVVGAIYLIFIGIKTFINREGLRIDLQGGNSSLSSFSSLKNGFLTNALNPKTTLFVVSTFTQVVDAHTPLAIQFGYGLLMSVVHFIWFGLVALFFSREQFRKKIMSYQKAVDRGIGSILVALGISLMFANLSNR